MQVYKQTQASIFMKHKQYQAYRDMGNYENARYKDKWVEREMSSQKHGRFVSRFEPLALCLRLHRNEGFSLKSVPQDHLVPATPTTSFLKNSWTHKSLTCSWKNNSHEPASSPRLQPLQFLQITKIGALDDLFSWPPTNILTRKILENGYSNR